MIPAAFDHVAPTSVDEALQLLAHAASEGKDVKVLGGGQSLIPVLKQTGIIGLVFAVLFALGIALTTAN